VNDPLEIPHEAIEAMGLTRKTLTGYIAEGMPHPCDDMDGARAWIAKYKNPANHTRRGAGRPKGSKNKPRTAFVPDLDDEQDDDGQAGKKIPTTSAELQAMLREDGVNAADLDLWTKAHKLGLEMDEAQIKRGRLVDADEASAAMMLWCVEIRERVLQAPARIASHASEFGLDHAASVRLRDVAAQVLMDVLASLRKDATTKDGE